MHFSGVTVHITAFHAHRGEFIQKSRKLFNYPDPTTRKLVIFV